jgi:hypothetical protein
MDELIAYRQELLSALERDVEELNHLGGSLAGQDWYRRLQGDSHTPHFFVFQIWALETHEFEVQVRRILAEDMPLLDIFEAKAWITDHYVPDEPVQTILQGFSDTRLTEIALLRELSPSDWSRAARHPWWGVHTLQWWVELQNEFIHQHIQKLTSVSPM